MNSHALTDLSYMLIEIQEHNLLTDTEIAQAFGCRIQHIVNLREGRSPPDQPAHPWFAAHLQNMMTARLAA